MSIYRLRFFFDSGSGVCLWAANDLATQRFGYPVEVDELRLTAATRQAIEDLIDLYDESLIWDDPGGPGHWSTTEWREFDDRIHHLLPVIRQELGSDFEIVDEHHYTRET